MTAATPVRARGNDPDDVRHLDRAPRERFLYALNPLAKIAAPVPAMLALLAVRDLQTPTAFLVLAYAVIFVGARLSARMLAVLLLAVPASLIVIGIAFSLWTDASRISHDVVVLQIGSWTLYGEALEVGFATALRLGAILTLALVGGLTTTGADLTRSMIQQLRVPYRVGYTALAAFRFVPRFGYELEVIRAAHRVRGASHGRGPIAVVRRRMGYVVPLLAGAIRHAERVALSMDSRAFGAYPRRTERYRIPFRARDVVFIALFWSATAAIFLTLRPWA
ncbi:MULTISPECIES: energy-coupling factor transporter transmembrane component T [unclassified Microbacterium]|uniref:energy-coupling factor transporter transmembrane component T n=1 Tax=unclassified Microbacterium TaxID=2609290 RepID=UPI000C2C2069|nr:MULTISPECIES: energy-coupling factor transporter transmembrane component T [unclassified Microbacterium]